MSRRTLLGFGGGAAVAGLLTVAGIGCGDGDSIKPEASPGTDKPTNSPTPPGSPSSSPDRPTATPKTPESPKVGYEELDKGLIYRTEAGEILNVPQIQGLRAELRTENDQQKVVYIAQPENPYGMSAEQYAGEFKPNVEVEQKQTGGVVLKSPVVLKLINDKLATIPEQKDKWVIPLPVDIRGSNTSENISLNFKKGYGDMGIPILEVDYTNSLPLINIIPVSSNLRVLLGGIYYKWGIIDELRLNEAYAEITPGKEMNHIDLLGSSPPPEFAENTTIQSKFGEIITSSQGPITISLTGLTAWYDVTKDKILSADNSPVFLAANTP